MTGASLLDGALEHLEPGAEGWTLTEARARALAAWLESRLDESPGLGVTELFKLVAWLEGEGAPAAGPLFAALRAVPAVIASARALRGQRESSAQTLVRAFTGFEDRRPVSKAPRVDADRPEGTIPGHAVMRPPVRPRPGSSSPRLARAPTPAPRRL